MVKPQDITAQRPGIGTKKLWWQCAKGHEWEATLRSRLSGRGCPYCAGFYVIQGETDLATTHPELAAQWHSTKNGDLRPAQVSAGSGKKIWWRCEKGHEWEASPSTRSKGHSCPHCSGLRAIQGETDLVTTHPELAKQWHPIKNGDLLPTQVSAGSGKEVWWRCEKGHEWQAEVASRLNGTNCPYCSGRYAIQGETDLATTHPELAKQWHSTKNGDLLPDQVKAGSNKEAWWQCEKGHEWQARVAGRRQGNGCPYCSGRLAIQGETDLATTYPELAKQWHLSKNGDLLPTQIITGSGKKVWWQCEKGHEWEASPNTRSKGSGCPHCAGFYAIRGETDLATTRPDLAKQWHPTGNGDLLPTQVTAGSGKKVWWQCQCGHEWKQTITKRTTYRGRCPSCKKTPSDYAKEGSCEK